MQKNFGTKQRCPIRAASVLLNRACDNGGLSYSSVASLLNRFRKFIGFAKCHGVSRLERISEGLVVSYAYFLKEQDYSPAYKQNLLSAVNTVMTEGYASYGMSWRSVGGREMCLPRRNNIRIAPTTTKEQLYNAIDDMPVRASITALLAREFGLRIKEAALIDARSAYEEANTSGVISVSEGTKGGRSRIVTVRNISQLDVLREAAEVQGRSQSMIPENMTWKNYRNSILYAGRAALKNAGIKDYHSLRAAFAADLYEEITCSSAPCNSDGKRTVSKQQDDDARMQISSQLGHGRVCVTTAYLGSKR